MKRKMLVSQTVKAKLKKRIRKNGPTIDFRNKTTYRQIVSSSVQILPIEFFAKKAVLYSLRGNVEKDMLSRDLSKKMEDCYNKLVKIQKRWRGQMQATASK